MARTVSLWWSLLWRGTLAIVILSYVVEPFAKAALPIDEIGIKLRPTIFWFVLGLIMWVVGAVSSHLFIRLIWGERLRLSSKQWLFASRALSVFFVALAILNWLIARFASTDTWVNFKLFWPYPIFMVLLLFLSARLTSQREA